MVRPPSLAAVRRQPLLARVGSLALVAVSAGLLAPAPVEAFTFQFNQTYPKTCEPVEVRWSGGTPPFKMFIIVRSEAPLAIMSDATPGGLVRAPVVARGSPSLITSAQTADPSCLSQSL